MARLRRALVEWIRGGAKIGTVPGALEWLEKGPVGHFGPVEPRVLSRSGQADLSADVTPLGEANDTSDAEGDGSCFLSLYGDRHGLLLLHRSAVAAGRTSAKQTQRAPHREVLVARSADELIAAAGLGVVEKRLFRAAGLLDPVPLWTEMGREGDPAATPDPTTVLDLAELPDRSRQAFKAIHAFAQQGKLGAADIDLLLKMARHLARSGTRPAR